jgi:ABC-type uncharacterized transport system ATPase subunit
MTVAPPAHTTSAQEECETRGAAIIYATHIFDGLESWPTHVAYVARGALQMLKKVRMCMEDGAWTP